MRLRADEHVSPNVVADTAANVDQEVVAAAIAGAKVDAVAGWLISVKTRALPAYAGHQIGSDLFTQAGLVDAIEVEQDRAIRLTKSSEVALAASPRSVEAKPNALVKDHIRADVGIKATLFRANQIDKSRCAAIGSPGGHDGTETKHGICLLGRSEIGGSKKHEDGGEEGKLSQDEPPVD